MELVTLFSVLAASDQLGKGISMDAYCTSKLHKPRACGVQIACDIKELCIVNMNAWQKNIIVARDIME